MKGPFIKKAFLFSALAHLVLVLFLWKQQESPLTPEPVEISLFEKSSQLSSPKPILETISKSDKVAKKSAPILGNKLLRSFSKPNFSSAFSSKEFSGEATSDIERYAKNSTEDDPIAEWGSGGGTFARNKDYLLFRRVYQNIDNILFYPGILARHRIEGFVQARMVLDATGECTWRFMQIKGADPYLRLFILDTLKQACQQNYLPFMNGRKLTNVDLSFKFALTEQNIKELAEQEKQIVGNTLLFYRNIQTSIMEWELGPFRGMFPIPVAYLNIPWIQENWDRLRYHKEPLEIFKQEFGSEL